jgi:carbon storage regulator CsrA
MLVLRRLCGQSITIGDNAEIIVKVLRNENGVVSIGVDAPMTVLVDRLEIYEKRLNALPSSDNNKSALFRRLEIFEKRLKKLRASNDSLADHHLCTS